VFGPLWVWLARSERPANATLAGGAIVLLAVLLDSFPVTSSSEGGKVRERSSVYGRSP
jgi:drug/metabolite transporter (DMT)-like permease